MAAGRLRIGFPAVGAYALTCDYRSFSLTGQNSTLTYGQIDQPPNIACNPGHGMTVDVGSGGGGLAGCKSQIAATAAMPNIKFVKFSYDWDDVEGAQGVYDFTLLHDIRDSCFSAGKKLWLIPRFQYFGGTPTSAAGRFPTYTNTMLSGSPGWVAWDGSNPASPPGSLILCLKVWNSTVMTAWLAMNVATAEEFDGDPVVDCFMIGETSIANLPGSGYSDQGTLDQFKNWAAINRGAWAVTGLRIYGNYLHTADDSMMTELIQQMKLYNIINGGPDNFSRTYQANKVHNGYSGGHSYIDEMGWASENQAPASSSGGASVLPAEIYDHNENDPISTGGSVDPNWYVWPRGIVGGVSWTQIVAFIDGIAGACNTTNPYGQADPPGLDIVYVSTGTPVAADNASVSVGWGSTALAADTACIAASITTGSTGRSAAASGFSTLNSYGDLQQQPTYLFSKTAGAGEANASVVPSGGAANNVLQAVGFLLRNAGAVHATHNASTTNANNSTPIVTPSLTVTQDHCEIVMVVSYQAGCTDFSTYDPDGDGSWIRKAFSVTAVGSDQTLAVYTKLQTTAANVAASTLNITGQPSGFTARVMMTAIARGP